MGSAYPTIATDALARFQTCLLNTSHPPPRISPLVHPIIAAAARQGRDRLQGKEATFVTGTDEHGEKIELTRKQVTFVTGTDEHGEKIALAAAKNGRTPQQHCDAVAEEYKQLWSKLHIAYDRFIRRTSPRHEPALDIAYDRFIRTTSPRHEAVVRQFYDRVKARGDVYRAQYEGRYCIACEEYKDEKELGDGTTCPTHLTSCEHRSKASFSPTPSYPLSPSFPPLIPRDANTPPYQDEKELVEGTTCPMHLTPCEHRSEDNLFFALPLPSFSACTCSQLISHQDEEELDEKELVEGTTCPTHLTPCEHRSEDNLFFALSSHQHDLEKIFQERPDFVQPSFRKNEVLAWVAEGARDFSISRAAVTWGIPVPDVPEQTIYVWFDALLGAGVAWGIPVPDASVQTIYVSFDALLGYISGLLEEGDEPSLDTAQLLRRLKSLDMAQPQPCHASSLPHPPPLLRVYISALLEEGDEPSLDTAVSRGWPASVHIIGKDILRFHAVYWPAMLMSAGLPTPTTVFGHGFLTKASHAIATHTTPHHTLDGHKMGKSVGNTIDPDELVTTFGADADGHKMGKSLGNTIDPVELVTTFGADAVRYFFLREIEFGSDGDFSKERFVNIVNANLANTIGNLVNRTLGLLKKNCSSTLSIDSAALPLDHPLRTTTAASMATAAACYAALDFSGACEAILAPAAAGNGFLEERAPWSKFKKGGADAEEAAADLAAVLKMAHCVLVLPVSADLVAVLGGWLADLVAVLEMAR
ncbi:unnamed protein product, partial [Closterium sp. NIES-65]